MTVELTTTQAALIRELVLRERERHMIMSDEFLECSQVLAALDEETA